MRPPPSRAPPSRASVTFVSGGNFGASTGASCGRQRTSRCWERPRRTPRTQIHAADPSLRPYAAARDTLSGLYRGRATPIDGRYLTHARCSPRAPRRPRQARRPSSSRPWACSRRPGAGAPRGKRPRHLEIFYGAAPMSQARQVRYWRRSWGAGPSTQKSRRSTSHASPRGRRAALAQSGMQYAATGGQQRLKGGSARLSPALTREPWRRRAAVGCVRAAGVLNSPSSRRTGAPSSELLFGFVSSCSDPPGVATKERMRVAGIEGAGIDENELGGVAEQRQVEVHRASSSSRGEPRRLADPRFLRRERTSNCRPRVLRSSASPVWGTPLRGWIAAWPFSAGIHCVLCPPCSPRGLGALPAAPRPARRRAKRLRPAGGVSGPASGVEGRFSMLFRTLDRSGTPSGSRAPASRGPPAFLLSTLSPLSRAGCGETDGPHLVLREGDVVFVREIGLESSRCLVKSHWGRAGHGRRRGSHVRPGQHRGGERRRWVLQVRRVSRACTLASLRSRLDRQFRRAPGGCRAGTRCRSWWPRWRAAATAFAPTW